MKNLTLKELRVICTTCGINYYNKTKSSLLNELSDFFSTNPQPPPSKDKVTESKKENNTLMTFGDTPLDMSHSICILGLLVKERDELERKIKSSNNDNLYYFAKRLESILYLIKLIEVVINKK